MGWKSPTGGSGTGWTNVPNAYDDNTGSYALEPATAGGNFGPPLELTVGPVLCDRIRAYLFYQAWCFAATIEVYYDDDYHEIGSGMFSSGWNYWDVVPGSPKKSKVVSKIRLTFLHYIIVGQTRVYEADVHTVMPRLMEYYKRRRAS